MIEAGATIYKNKVFTVASSGTQEKTFVRILEQRVGKDDMTNPDNYQIMKAYVVSLLPGIARASDLISCKDHRVSALHSFHVQFHFQRNREHSI